MALLLWHKGDAQSLAAQGLHDTASVPAPPQAGLYRAVAGNEDAQRF